MKSTVFVFYKINHYYPTILGVKYYAFDLTVAIYLLSLIQCICSIAIRIHTLEYVIYINYTCTYVRTYKISFYECPKLIFRDYLSLRFNFAAS